MSTPETAKSTPKIAMSTSRIAISTPRAAPDVCRFRQRPPYDVFFFISSGPRLSWLAIVALMPLASTLLTFRRVVSPESSNLVERQLSFSKFYRSRTGRLPSTKLLEVA